MRIEKLGKVVVFELMDNSEVYGTDMVMISCILNADEVLVKFSSPENKAKLFDLVEDGMGSVYEVFEDGEDYTVFHYVEAQY